MSLHSSKDQSHDAKEKTFMRLFGKVGADAYSIEDDSNYSKPVEFSSMPAAPPKFEYETPVEPEHRCACATRNRLSRFSDCVKI